jgi:hypothetical protein
LPARVHLPPPPPPFAPPPQPRRARVLGHPLGFSSLSLSRLPRWCGDRGDPPRGRDALRPRARGSARAVAVSPPGTGTGASRARAPPPPSRLPLRGRVPDDAPDVRARDPSAPLVPRVFSDAERSPEAEAVEAKRLALLETSEPFPWRRGDEPDDSSSESFGLSSGVASLADAARFVGWRVANLADGESVGEVAAVLGMAGGEVVAQMGEDPGDLDEYSEEYSFGSPWGGEDDRDDDEDEYFDEEEYSEDEYPGWEVIYEEEPEEEDEVAAGADGSENDVSSSFDGVAAETTSPSSSSGSPPLSLVLRVRGFRTVSGAGGVRNVAPVAHLVPLVPAIVRRWAPDSELLAVDPPPGLLDLGTRRSELAALRKDLLPYCSSGHGRQKIQGDPAAEDSEAGTPRLGMPRRRTLAREGREDLVERVTRLGDWSSVALALGFESSRKPDGYWENIDLVRDALLELVDAFWFEETDEETGQTFFYNDVSGALTFDPPAPESGGGLDAPVMPAMSDVLEARRWDVHQAILLHGGYKEVALTLGWMQKRTSENRHLLKFASLEREMEAFLDEYAEALEVPHPGRLPTLEMLASKDRDDLAQGVRWHGGVREVARKMNRLEFAASRIANEPRDAAEALRRFAEEEAAKKKERVYGASASEKKSVSLASSETDTPETTPPPRRSTPETPETPLQRSARLLATPVMPTDAALRVAGRHDLRWALRAHDRERLAELAGLADPNRPDPSTNRAAKRRLGYAEARRFMRSVAPRLASAARFREWSRAGARPWFIPADPRRYYAERNQWRGWDDFLGGGTKTTATARWRRREGGRTSLTRAVRSDDDEREDAMEEGPLSGGPDAEENRSSPLRRVRDFRRCAEASAYVRSLGGAAPRTAREYRAWASSGARPRDVPSDPSVTYGRRGEWVSWKDFLGGKKKKKDDARRGEAKTRRGKNETKASAPTRGEGEEGRRREPAEAPSS